ncbi:SUT2-h1 [Hordeum vulgare]|nr:SUT2-h1 [Hordeum vulgare]
MDSGGGATTIRMPYRHIHDTETELVRINSDAQPPKEEQASGHRAGAGAPKYRVVLACMVAVGMQFGWALQLSLLTPYIQITDVSEQILRLQQEFEAKLHGDDHSWVRTDSNACMKRKAVEAEAVQAERDKSYELLLKKAEENDAKYV